MSKKTRAPSELADFDRLMEQNRRLTDEVKRRIDQLAAINSVATMVGQSLDLDRTFDTALGAVLSVIRVEASGISLIDKKSQELVLMAQRGWKRDFVKMGMRMPVGHGLAWHAITKDEVVVTGDVAQDKRIEYPAFQEEGVKAQALAPMHARGKVIGILSVLSYSPYEFSPEELTVLGAIADQIGVALDNARLFDEVASRESHLRAILQSTADAILAIDAERKVMMFNAAAESLFGTAADVILGQPVEAGGSLPEALVKGLSDAASRTDHTPRAFDLTIDGSANERVVSCLISPIMDDHKTTQGWVAVLRDITPLREIDALKTQAIQTAAHDLRSPLAGAESSLNMLSEAFGETNEIQKRLFEITFESLRRMQRLIDNLLNIEQIEYGLVFERAVDIMHVVSRAIDEQRASAHARGVVPSVEVQGDLPTIRGSDIWLERAVTNYVSNAIKFAPHGSTVHVRAWREGGEIFIEVEDSGPGIPLEAQTHLFERFYRVPHQSADADPEGTGLGLAIVKLVVTQHEGRVYVRSQPGKGSVFGMSLPIGR